MSAGRPSSTFLNNSFGANRNTPRSDVPIARRFADLTNNNNSMNNTSGSLNRTSGTPPVHNLSNPSAIAAEHPVTNGHHDASGLRPPAGDSLHHDAASGSNRSAVSPASSQAFDLESLDVILRTVMEPQTKLVEKLLKGQSGDATSLQAQNASLHDQNAKLLAQIAALSTKNTSLLSTNTELQKEVNRLKADITRHQQEESARIARLEAWQKQCETEDREKRASAPPAPLHQQQPQTGIDPATLRALVQMQQMAALQQQQQALSAAQYGMFGGPDAFQQQAVRPPANPMLMQQQQQALNAASSAPPPAPPPRMGGDLQWMPSMTTVPKEVAAAQASLAPNKQPATAAPPNQKQPQSEAKPATATVQASAGPISSSAAATPVTAAPPAAVVGGFAFSGQPKIAPVIVTRPAAAAAVVATTTTPAKTTAAQQPLFSGFAGFGRTSGSTTVSTSMASGASAPFAVVSSAQKSSPPKPQPQQQPPAVATTKASIQPKPMFDGFAGFGRTSGSTTVSTSMASGSSAPFATNSAQAASPFSSAGFKPDTPSAAPATPKTTTADSKPVFAGFGFSSSPAAAPATKPTTGFSFTPTAAAATNSTSPHKVTTQQSPSPAASGQRQRTESEQSDHYEPSVEFTPVVPLPDLVEVVTGEEEEQVLFNERAKLYRFMRDANEYKERGVGDLKLLKHKQTGKVRLLLRREQVHKLAANHYVTSEMKLTPMQSSTRAYVWTANDFSDEEIKLETFAARFKNDDVASDFKRLFEQAVQESTSATPTKPTSNGTAASKQQQPATTKATGGFGDAFKPKAGSWECSGCMTRNDADKTKCVCCETPKEGTAADPQAAAQAKPAPAFNPTTFSTPSAGGFSFGMGASPATVAPAAAAAAPFKPATTVTPKATTGQPAVGTSGFGDAFKPKAGSWECQACLTRNDQDKSKCVCCETPKDGAAESTPAAKPAGGSFNPTTFSTPAAGGFSFGMGASPATVAPAAAAPASASPASSFSFKPSSLASPKPPPSANSSVESTSPMNFSFKLDGSKSKPTTTAAAPPAAAAAFGSAKPVFSAATSLSKPDTAAAAPAKTPTGFTFGQSATSAPLSASSSGLSFGSLAAATGDAAGGFGKKTGLFDKPTAKPFADVNSSSPKTGGNEDEEAEHFEPNVEFTPVVPLPDLVEKKTGEEDENVLFNARCKLYRFVPELKEYKERGVGDLKLLEHKQSGRVRLIMRREQVHKLAANHSVTGDMKLTPMQTSSRAFTWAAMDYSEEELKAETFAARFKADDVAEEFRVAFGRATTKMAGIGSSPAANQTPTDNNSSRGGSQQRQLFGSSANTSAGGGDCQQAGCSGCVGCEHKDKDAGATLRALFDLGFVQNDKDDEN